MAKYEVILYWSSLYWSSDDEALIAEVPELAGCAVDGVTHLKLNRPIPEPKGRILFA